MKVTIEFTDDGCVRGIEYDPPAMRETTARFMAEAARDAADIAEGFDGASETPLSDAYDWMVDSTATLNEQVAAENAAEAARKAEWAANKHKYGF